MLINIFQVEGGKGDEEFRDLWVKEMTPLCENHTALNEQGLRFVEIVAKLMEHLLQYRDVIHAESQEHRMLCTVNLLEFYSEINRNEMYIRCKAKDNLKNYKLTIFFMNRPDH